MNTEQTDLFANANPAVKFNRQEISAMQAELNERLRHQKEYAAYYWLAEIGPTGEHADIWTNIVAEDRAGNQALRKRLQEAKASRKRLIRP